MRTPQHALLAFVIRSAAAPAGQIVECPVCHTHYDRSDINASYPHNNH